jgi:hypothetical protein
VDLKPPDDQPSVAESTSSSAVETSPKKRTRRTLEPESDDEADRHLERDEAVPDGMCMHSFKCIYCLVCDCLIDLHYA